MVFNSLQYALFLPIVVLLCALIGRRLRLRNITLLLASYYFYGSWDWRFLALLIFSTLVDFAVGVWMGDGVPDPDAATVRRRRRILVLSLLSNLGILCIFKYFDFFAQSAQTVLARLGVEASLPLLHVVLPVGLSFYTFQSMSYTINVYRGTIPVERSLLDFALYVAFFPQLVAGPIERPMNLLPQVNSVRPFSRDRFYTGCYLLGWGLFKKVVLADNAAMVADKVFGAHAPGGITVLIGAYCFAIQIYCDFSGYTDMARGSAKLLGFELIDNFNHPYFAVNPSDFWRRWHISLSNWLRDYLYIPLGGNRKGTLRTYVNLMLTMTLGGLWHGAAWTFVIWGVFHGSLLCLHRAVSPWLERTIRPGTRGQSALWLAVRVVVFFHITCVGWLIFRAKTAPQLGQMLGALIRHPRIDRDVLHDTDLLIFALCAGTLTLAEIIQLRARDEFICLRLPTPVRAGLYAAVLLAIVLFGNDQGAQFIYFQF
jgi:D-alanyl-lipoteichoic acid acyltransferase DltB (MBOAT superfamily)